VAGADSNGEDCNGTDSNVTAGIRVRSVGPQALIQDLGRPGHADIGLSPSGALDPDVLRQANRLAGNEDGAAGVEILLGGLTLEFSAGTRMAVTGAAGRVELDGKPVARNASVDVPAGAVLAIRPAERGLRYYLAVRGGLDAERVMGSTSTDVLSGTGPAPLAAGMVLRTGNATAGHAVREGAAAPATPWVTVPQPPENPAVRVLPGPRRDWFTNGSWLRLIHGSWTVSADSNRVGIRLEGRPLERLPGFEGRELPSEGMVTGALQVPPSGLPTVFLADHPVTGGYPVIAVVHSADLHLLAQVRPGQRLRFLG
jgi:biotin-dependent carboxylase-like uncharacterized protein